MLILSLCKCLTLCFSRVIYRLTEYHWWWCPLASLSAASVLTRPSRLFRRQSSNKLKMNGEKTLKYIWHKWVFFIMHLFKRKFYFDKKESMDTGPDIFLLSLFHFILTFSAQERGRSGWQVSQLSGPHSFIIGYKLSTRILLKTRIGGARRIIDQGAGETRWETLTEKKPRQQRIQTCGQYHCVGFSQIRFYSH